MHVRHFVTMMAAVVCATVAASAQGTITLQGGFDQSVTFAGGTGAGATLGACNDAGSCSLYGLASGSGGLSAMGLFFVQSDAGALSFSPGAGGTFTLSSTAPTPGFALYGLDETSDHAGLLLAGSLNLTTLSQAAGGGAGNASLQGNLLITAGLLANALGSASVPLQLNLQFPPGAGIGNLAGLTGSLSALFTGGSVGQLTPTPEPAGVALLVLGAILLAGYAGAARLRGLAPGR